MATVPSLTPGHRGGERSTISGTYLDQDTSHHYVNDSFGFEFRYPGEVNLLDFTVPGRKRVDPDKVTMHLGAVVVDSAPIADGPCSTAHPDAYRRQQRALESARPGNPFEAGFAETTRGVTQSTVFINRHGTTVASGVSVCQGVADDDDPATLQYVAVAFHGNVRVQLVLYLDNEQAGGVRVRDVETQAAAVAEGHAGGETQRLYETFRTVVESLVFR